MVKPRLSDLRPDQIQRLINMSAQDMSFSAAAAELGMDRRTLKAAAERMGKAQWLAKLFPPKKGFSGTRYRPSAMTSKTTPPAQKTITMQAATMSWRPNSRTV